MAKRSPKVAHPQTLISEYLLSGLIKCGKCGAKMFGSKVKSGKFSYYACHHYLNVGSKTVCNAIAVNKQKED